MKNNISTWGRLLLGSFLIIYAANAFLHFFPSGYGKMPYDAMKFIDAVVPYLPILYIFEIVVGLMLILNKWTPFILIVLAPLSLAFLIFMFSNEDIAESWSALLVAALNILLMFDYKEKYKSLFEA